MGGYVVSCPSFFEELLLDIRQSWGGGSDSYFEYLIKYTRLNGTADPLWADTWKIAVDSSIRTLLKVGGHPF